MVKILVTLSFSVALLTGCAGAVNGLEPSSGDSGSSDCTDVPSCPTDGESCFLQADSYGRLLALWACPQNPTGNTPGCFLAHGCSPLGRTCVAWSGTEPDGGPTPDGGPFSQVCWIQEGPGDHPVAFWSCPADYSDECH